MNMKLKLFIATFLGTFAGLIGTASAHVVVQPSQVGVAAFQVFMVNVPTEKDNPTVALKLLVPPGLAEVTPTVKSGWQISTKKDTKGDITEIDWTGGSIPPNLRDEFTFSAEAPPQPTTLKWKAYQTYQDGSVVSWDATPAGSDDASGDKGPYSTTKVINDLSAPAQSRNSNDPLAYIMSGAALIVALLAFARTFTVKRKQK